MCNHNGCNHNICNHHKRKCIKWTLTRFRSEAQRIHGNKYNYDKITESHIKNKDSKVPIKCNKCNHEWNPSIHSHIKNKNGCPKCAGNLRWNLQRFLEAAQQTHGDKYDYSAVTEKHIRKCSSRVPVRCRQCGFCWSVTIDNHINKQTGCKKCSGHMPWDRSRFVEEAQRLNGDKHDYSEIQEDHFGGIHSHVPIRCKVCGYRWSPQIGNYIHHESQCPKCSGHMGWDHPRFIAQAKHIHGDAYNYDLVRPEDVTGYYSKIPITCNTCHKIWSPTVGHHIHSKSGCPYCCKSRGERLVAQILDLLKDRIGPYIQEVHYPDIPQYHYDFYFIYKDQRHIIEFDGIQHFEEIDLFTKKESFEYRRLLDKIKTLIALTSGVKLIRIDYTQLNNLQFHIETALESDEQVYLSTPSMYDWLTDPEKSLIDPEDLKKCAPPVYLKLCVPEKIDSNVEAQ